MSFKKNAFSYFVWILFIMCNLVVFSFLSMLCAKALGGIMPITALGLVAAFFGILFVIYFVTGYLSKKLYSITISVEKEKKIKNRLILEGVLAVGVLAAGVGLRIYLLPTAGETAAYFDVAKVAQDNISPVVPVQSSVYYYLCLLHGMFLVFGNQWIAGIWLQIVLQLMAGIVLYFVIRKMAGVWVALITLGYLMFVPSAVRTSLMYSPDMLYLLLWSIGLLAVILYLNAGAQNIERKSVGRKVLLWLSAVIVGVIAGFLTYVDITGILLLIPIIMLPMISKENKNIGELICKTILALMAMAGGFVGSIYLDGFLSNARFERILYAWFQTFEPEIPNIITLFQNSTVEVMILLILMAVNVFSFFRRKDRDIITVWMLMTFVLALLYVMGITTVSMSGRALLLTLMCVIASIGCRELFQVTPMKEKIEQEEDTQGCENEPVTGNPAEQSAAVGMPRFIENPLPLPKKHVKRTMDYAFVPENSQMKYDVEISENDDFDV